MQFTKEQNDFFHAVEWSNRNLILESVAGSGKTTSIVQSLNYIDDEEPILCCSFTKLAAAQLGVKIAAQNFTKTKSSTLNSIGWGVCRQNVRGITLDANKTLNILQAQLDRAPMYGMDSRRVFQAMSGPVRRLVSLLKAYVTPISEVMMKLPVLAQYHSVDLPEGTSREADFARKELYERTLSVYRQSISFQMTADFDDQKLFPVLNQWAMPQFKKVIVDECQDCNHNDIQLVKLMKAERNIFVGDRMQAMYLFRGSLLNAMDIIKEEFQCQYMTLSVCFRCADDILIEPKQISPLIKSPEPNPKGKGTVANVTTPEFLERVGIGDYVLCRTTAPLVKRCLQLLRQGTPALVKGKEIGLSLLKLIDKILAEMPGADVNSNDSLLEFITQIGNYRVETVNKLEAAKRDDAASRVSDECECLEFFAQESRTIDEIAHRIEALFTDNDSDDKVVLLLTAHKSKGLEADRVWILRPDLMPFPKAKQEHEIEVERRIRYVALTRAALERYHVMKEPDEK